MFVTRVRHIHLTPMNTHEYSSSITDGSASGQATDGNLYRNKGKNYCIFLTVSFLLPKT